MAAAEDYRYWAYRKEESIENYNGCISDDNESHKKDTQCSFVDLDGRRVFVRAPKARLPECGLVESQYVPPGPPRNEGVDHLGGFEESDPKKGSGIVQSTCMLHPTLMRRKAHKRVRHRFPLKD